VAIRRQALRTAAPKLSSVTWQASRERLQEPGQRSSGWLPSIQEVLNQVRCQQRKPQQTAEVSPLDSLRRGDLGDRSVPPLIEHALIAERSRPRPHQRRVVARRDRRHAIGHLCDDGLPARPASDGQGHPDRDAGGGRRSAAITASGGMAVTSRARCPPSESSINIACYHRDWKRGTYRDVIRETICANQELSHDG
jgi:hypothetical protein